mgnify:FL=1
MLHVHPGRPRLREHTLRLEHLRVLSSRGQCTLPARRRGLLRRTAGPHEGPCAGRRETRSAPWARPSFRRRARTLLRPTLAPPRTARGWPARARSLQRTSKKRSRGRRGRAASGRAAREGERERERSGRTGGRGRECALDDVDLRRVDRLLSCATSGRAVVSSGSARAARGASRGARGGTCATHP